MARCYNCGCEISDADKTRLCEECKKVLLPFVKFMDASTSSAVRRLISNEDNLRQAGVTDNGMEYLLRICELHDKKKAEESPAMPDEPETVFEKDEDLYDATFDTPDGMGDAVLVEEKPQPKPEHYSDIEVPLDKPLNIIRKPYGQYLPAVEIILGIIAAAQLIWFFLDLFLWVKVDFAAVGGCLTAVAMVYVTDVVRRMTHDVDEVKKHFR